MRSRIRIVLLGVVVFELAACASASVGQVDAATDAADGEPDGAVVEDAGSTGDAGPDASTGDAGPDAASTADAGPDAGSTADAAPADAASSCPPLSCSLHCIGGLNTDTMGCEVCECRYETMMTWVEDVSTSAFGTFASHNQRVVETPHGIYLTYQLNEQGSDQNGDWKLVRSQDRGATWTAVYSASGTRPPAVVADNAGNVHLVTSDATADKMHVYSFSGATLVTHHDYSGIRCDAKFTALYDPTWNNLYIGTQYGRFLAIWLETFGVMHDYQVFQDQGNQSPYACAQYPQLALDNSGNIHFATTTSNLSDTHVYRNILHVFASPLTNGQLAWARIARPGESGAQGVAIPIRPDEYGDALEINDYDERGQPGVVSVHLTNFISKGDYAHFFYTVVREGIPEWRTHYKRINRWTGAVDVDLDGDTTPIAGQTIVLKPYGGFFSTASVVDPATPLYLTSGERDLGQIGVLVSHDNGVTWQDYAITDEGPMTWSNITGARYSDGRVMAAFTSAPTNPAYAASVKYLGFYPR